MSREEERMIVVFVESLSCCEADSTSCLMSDVRCLVSDEEGAAGCSIGFLGRPALE